ncbi:MAG: TetR/AcrR family transcriptional regulator [Thermomicrobiales bacterium]|nr:TetR/AcrR family transcriptional regulator [Thermomicrobiales bacterium]
MAAAVASGVSPVASDGKGRILREARSLFTAHGYMAVSMQQIADAAAVNKATLYHHFRDKEELFVAVMREEFTGARAVIAAELDAGGPLRERLARVARVILAGRQTDLSRLTTDLREHVSEERRAALMAQCGHPWDVIEPAIAEAVASGDLRDRDPQALTQLFLGMVWSALWRAKHGAPVRQDPDALAALIVEVFFDGAAPCAACAVATDGDPAR